MIVGKWCFENEVGRHGVLIWPAELSVGVIGEVEVLRVQSEELGSSS